MSIPILEKTITGTLPIGEKIIDVHTHVERGTNYYHIPYSDDDSVVKEMGRYGIDYAFTFSFSGVASDFNVGNNHIIGLVKKYGDKFAGFTTLNINYPQLWSKELDRCWEAGLSGIKLIPFYQGKKTTDQDITAILKWADRHRCPILNHSWDSPAMLKKWAIDFPDACFLIGHASLEYTEAVNKCENVFQTTCAVLYKNQFEKMCSEMDTDKIVYGSDFTDLDMALSLGPILWGRVSDDVKRKVLGFNAQRIIDRYIRRT
jgi:predicted TIM-barrel fold metal-dependent hydrolase